MTRHELRQIRERAGLSQSGLASLLGVRQNTVGRWERGERAIPPFLPHALADILRATAERPAAP